MADSRPDSWFSGANGVGDASVAGHAFSASGPALPALEGACYSLPLPHNRDSLSTKARRRGNQIITSTGASATLEALIYWQGRQPIPSARHSRKLPILMPNEADSRENKQVGRQPVGKVGEAGVDDVMLLCQLVKNLCQTR